jgi:hypothetical protein
MHGLKSWGMYFTRFWSLGMKSRLSRKLRDLKWTSFPAENYAPPHPVRGLRKEKTAMRRLTQKHIDTVPLPGWSDQQNFMSPTMKAPTTTKAPATSNQIHVAVRSGSLRRQLCLPLLSNSGLFDLEIRWSAVGVEPSCLSMLPTSN